MESRLSRWVWGFVVCLTVAATTSAFEMEIALREHLGHTWDAEWVQRRVVIRQGGAVFAERLALFSGHSLRAGLASSA